MRFCAGDGAQHVLRLWIALAGIAVTALVAVLAGLLTPWLLIACGLVGAATLFLFLWYPSRYSRSMQGHFDGGAIRAEMGVLWRRQIFIPMDALRTFEIWDTPLQRKCKCRSLILRFAGGSTILPLLSEANAYYLAKLLEEAEEG